jgi:hypothetical protein
MRRTQTMQMIMDVRAKCPKSMLNGPCGGIRDGLCEIRNEVCVWVVLFNKLKAACKLEELGKLRMPEDAL